MKKYLAFGKSNEKSNSISYNEFKELNSFDNFKYDCSKNQVIMRLTYEQYEECLEALKAGEEVNIIS